MINLTQPLSSFKAKYTTRQMLVQNAIICVRCLTMKPCLRQLTGTALVTYKAELKLNALQKQLIVGTLLGHATIAHTYGRAIYKIKFEQKADAAPYVNDLYKHLQCFVGTPPKLRFIKQCSKTKARSSVHFRTYAHDCFKYYYNLFYAKTHHCAVVKKRVPKNIAKLLTARALAYWYMDDGGLSKKTSGSIEVCFATHGFCYQDQKLLVKALKNNWNINSSIHKDRTYYKLVLLKQSHDLFMQLIRPYVHSYFDYKLLGQGCQGKQLLKANKTI